ncbi:hypothetical protein [Nonomuraea sp. NPDC049400]|uniref:hypothetical protein n=1 Tax=Nonomuraea sp. NPDC049400 TaxID=3364352 RepID=UPI0037BDDB11
MSVCDNEQLGAEPAVETCGLRLRHRPIGLAEGSRAVVGGSGPARRAVPCEWMGLTA